MEPGVLFSERGYLRKANNMWRVPSLVFAYVWSYYIRCPRCGAPQRVTKNGVQPGVRVLCWQCKRIFSP